MSREHSTAVFSCARPVFKLLLVLHISALLAISGCGSDSAPPPPDPPPPPIEGVVSGTLLVPPNHVVEEEINDTPFTAQSIGQAVRLAGSAAATDSGFPLPGSNSVLTDIYRLEVTTPVRVTLTLGADDLYHYDSESQTITEIINDLNLAALDLLGTPVAISDGLTATESIEILEPGPYFIGVAAAVGSSSYVLAVTPLQFFSADGAMPPTAARVTPPDFVAGEVLVKSRRSTVASPKQRSELGKAHGADYQKTFSSGVDLFTLPRAGVSAQLKSTQTLKREDLSAAAEHLLQAATREVVRRLQADPNVLWAEPNYIRRPKAVPDDEQYELQWHYEQINLPDAWDTTTGSDETIVAVLDTGILSGHPDLAGRLIAGYDFVSEEFRGQDGDGIDPDSEDPGDDPRGQASSFHGTHVAGTVGASTNNLIGVAGVTWQTRIMPIRVLGAGGGTSAEVAQGIRYAAGLTNDSGTVPTEPARIINMSLGGPGLSAIEQEAITAARNAGTIVIAAAGNESDPGPYSPAGLNGVISVSAVGATGEKASYSNYGPTVDVAAPGGEFWDSDGDDRLDAVRSTLGDDQGNFDYAYYQGTSMASPHMAGVAALMLAVNPMLTPEDIDRLIAGTHAETTTRITRDLGSEGWDPFYGHGLIDAAAAVLAASEVTGGGNPGPQGSRLSVYPDSIDLGNYLTSGTFDISNGGIGTLNITSVTTGAPWVTVEPVSGEAPFTINIQLDRSHPDLEEGRNNLGVGIQSDAGEGEAFKMVSVFFDISPFEPGNAGPVLVQLRSADGSNVLEQQTLDALTGYDFEFPPVEPGDYLVTVGTDRDNDGEICEIEDACVSTPQEVTINASGDDVSNIEMLLLFGLGEKLPPVDDE